MASPQPYFWPQSQISYGRMLTRMGRFDFATKFKITLQSLIPGFGPFCRATLLIAPESKSLIFIFTQNLTYFGEQDKRNCVNKIQTEIRAKTKLTQIHHQTL